MDIISYQKAMKAKRAIASTQDRLGYNGTEQDLDITDVYTNTKERLEELEKKDPEVELLNMVSDVSKHTMINLNKHNLRVNSLLNHTRYQLTDMIVDDFQDDSGIDKEKSKNIKHILNSENNFIGVGEAKRKQEILQTTSVSSNIHKATITPNEYGTIHAITLQ